MTPKTAMVLSAGRGTRMRELGERLPKPLVPLGGITLIDRVLDRLQEADVERAIVNVHHLADKLEVHLATRTGTAIVISDERDALLETGGGVKKALPLIGEDPFFIHNSDSVWVEAAKPALPSMGAAWRPQLMDWLLLIAPRETVTGYDGQGDFWFEADRRLRRRESGEDAPYVFAGVSITAPSAFNNAPDGAFSLNFLWDKALESGRLYGHKLEGVWMHVGTPEAIDEAEKVLNGGAV